MLSEVLIDTAETNGILHLAKVTTAIYCSPLPATLHHIYCSQYPWYD